MIPFVLLCIAVEFGFLAHQTAHTAPWTSALFGPTFAYIAISGVAGAYGLGEIMRRAEIGIRRAHFRWKHGITTPITAYVLVDGPQPTL